MLKAPSHLAHRAARIIALAGLLTVSGAAAAAPAESPPSTAAEPLSLITRTPEEGFQLAIALARKGVTETQQDVEVLHALRPGYAHNADSLIAASQVVAIHFHTIAAANDYWRD